MKIANADTPTPYTPLALIFCLVIPLVVRAASLLHPE
jgi:hypothetical protein